MVAGFYDDVRGKVYKVGNHNKLKASWHASLKDD